MTTIAELSDYLLYEAPDKAAELLALADMYIRSFNEAPEQFILPHDDALTEFWDMIEQEIANGERIPKWE